MTNEKLLEALKPLLQRVRRDCTALKPVGKASFWAKDKLTTEMMIKHLEGGDQRGACPINAGQNTCRCAVLDFDSHGGETPWEEMQTVAEKVRDLLESKGVHPLMFRSSGGRGVHLIMLWEEEQDAASVRAFLRSAIDELGFKDGTKGVVNNEIEIFPKQDSVPADGYGNYFILPLGGKSRFIDPVFGAAVEDNALAADDIVWQMSAPVPEVLVDLDDDCDLATFAASQKTDLTPEQVVEVLGRADVSELDYDAWVGIGMAIYHQFDGSEEGFEIFNEWSSTDEREGQYDERTCRKHWDSFGGDRSKPKTFKSVLDVYGQPTPVGVVVLANDEEALEEAYELVAKAQTVTDLLEVVPTKIRVMKGLTVATCKSIAHRIKARARELGSVLSVSDIHITTNEIVKAVRANGERGFNESRLARDWVFLTQPCEFFKPETGERVGVKSLDIQFQNEMPYDMSGNRKLPSKMFAEFGGRTVYADMYWPKQYGTGDIFFNYCGQAFVNSYRGIDVPDADPDWREGAVWQACHDHIHGMFDDARDADAIIKWMAHNVQKPGEKILWAPIVLGVQGDGKTTLGRMLSAAMGARHVKNVGVKEVFSPFSGWATGACVGIIEEIRVTGHMRSDAMDTLKPFITNATVNVVRKGQDGVDVLNTQNYMAFTNHPDALMLVADDRRWGVFETRYASREELVAHRGEDYWSELYSMINNGGRGIRGWLMAVNLADFNPAQAPVCNQAKLNMMKESISDDASNIMAIIEELEIDGEPIKVITTAHINSRLRDMGFHPLSDKRMGQRLKEIGAYPHQMKVGGERVKLWLTKSYYAHINEKFGKETKAHENPEINKEIKVELENFHRAVVTQALG